MNDFNISKQSGTIAKSLIERRSSNARIAPGFENLLECGNNIIIIKDGYHLAVWSYMVLLANHEVTIERFKGIDVTIEPGQFIISGHEIARCLRFNEKRVGRIISSFVSIGVIERQKSNINALFAIPGWH